MLKWYKKLYIGDNAKKRQQKIIWRVNHGKVQFDIYLVTLAVNPANLLEIVSANQLLQKTIRRRCPMIVGLADGYDEAVGLVQKIVEETYQTQGDADVRRYLEQLPKEKKRTRAGD
ncbi:MAG: hypothetical protein EOM40_06200 [Clostridia bacterium]|nr:hypothetical protein [Clostridia bacterium]NCC43856.1 hypothetical protein [Clostridia bacterium]